MPKVDFSDDKGVFITAGGGWYRNGAEISATATELDQYTLTGKISSIHTGTEHVYVPVPTAGTLVAVHTSVSGNPSAECKIRIHIGATVGNIGEVTIENGSSAGSVDSLTGLSSAVTAGGYLRAISNNGASSDVDAYVTFVIAR